MATAARNSDGGARPVFVAGVDNAVGRAVATLFRAGGTTVFEAGATAPIDVLDAASWREALERCADSPGPPAIVVLARHHVTRSKLDSTSRGAFEASFVDHGTAGWLAQQQAILALRAAGGGVLVHVLSVLARVAAPGVAALCAASRGLLMSAKSAALECARARDGVVVNVVLAGRIEGDSDHWPDGSLLPRAPVVSVDEIAAAVRFMACEGAAYMTGADLPVDGGFLAS
jgi:NAD(P)-dependent dehydrogenase (short-subunit alcohol dehydrogenase family)